MWDMKTKATANTRGALGGHVSILSKGGLGYSLVYGEPNYKPGRRMRSA